ncbi:alpha-L-fucosidase [Microbacter margulisiae]|uniref:Glycoside hydrolase family 29 N-terminal domain-containing protein n=1 Tax=Microbacter margulisiae TaxID=1350067 RepID=A0A7W5DPJ4_9PORP|nr:alpha-L-fucosidase [Microbacter margulisiae]MBB3186204.1 hypothetical protein [Microbacter margulisiae]
MTTTFQINSFKIIAIILIFTCFSCRNNTIETTHVVTHPSTDWMVGKWGIMIHWIAPGPAPAEGPWISDLNTAVNNFEINKFLAQFDSCGADYLMFTIGQNSSMYCSPNHIMDSLAGSGHCSNRDLALELAVGVHNLGKKFIAYLPAEVNAPTDLHIPFAWNPGGNQEEFENRYTSFIKDYSEKFGNNLDGWWFDGVYEWSQFPIASHHWPLWINAARAGNPNAVVSFNNGSFYSGYTTPVTTYQDYLSGECWNLENGEICVGTNEWLYLPTSRFIPGTQCQFHVQVPIDCNKSWSNQTPGPMPPPSYTDDELFSAVLNVLKVGGTFTINVGIYQEGYISNQTLEQLKRLNIFLKSNLPISN